ncbi:uncharacterized protein LOC119347250 [Triticum dicoccoides]|uniref:uncharacterized protein LOC119347250 n=1 Tax=Triticum dicoccoides TaxID=85692 RepID=UPI00188FDF00|nr:uncharacterized protein LOC119347250 [Triticum dicoccoides]
MGSNNYKRLPYLLLLLLAIGAATLSVSVLHKTRKRLPHPLSTSSRSGLERSSSSRESESSPPPPPSSGARRRTGPPPRPRSSAPPDPASSSVLPDAYARNAAAVGGLLFDLRSCVSQALQVLGGKGTWAVKGNEGRGKLLPRDRIDRLLDPGASFLVLSQQRTRASWTTKAHGARKRRMEFVRHRHGGGGGWARTKEDRAPIFFQDSEQHQEEELKNDHQEAPPQQKSWTLAPPPLANGEAPNEASSKAMRRDRAPVIV